MSAFGRYLSVWIALAIIAGLALGQIAPGLASFLATLEYGSINFVVAVLIWAMVCPMMMAAARGSRRRVSMWRQIVAPMATDITRARSVLS